MTKTIKEEIEKILDECSVERTGHRIALVVRLESVLSQSIDKALEAKMAKMESIIHKWTESGSKTQKVLLEELKSLKNHE